MSNYTYNIDDNFDFDILNLGNPTLVNNNNYYSKITHGNACKNVYIQLPKCSLKQGIIKNSNRCYCELNYLITEKKVIEFFESLEKVLIDKIYDIKNQWFYQSETITKNDIEDLTNSLIKPYKHGKNILIKNYIKLDKINIYDENEKKLSLNEYKSEYEIIPLVNINGIKFSSKNFSIELFLSQAMVIYPSEDFEEQVLIKLNKNNISNISNTSIKSKIIQPDLKKQDEDLKKQEEEDLKEEEELKQEDIEAEDLKEYEDLKEEEEDLKEDLKEYEDLKEDLKKDLKEETSKFKYLINDGLEEVKLDNIDESDKNIQLKSHKEIHLEIYKTAKQKAKDIRKSAIQAYMEAKQLKAKYNLFDIESESDSDDNLEFIN